MTLIKSYKELLEFDSYDERLEYLRLYSDNPSNEDRAFMNSFYKSHAWKQVRDFVIHRDLGCDLGASNIYIDGPILVHHINPITEEDILNGSELILDPNNLISVSYETHNKIHYSNKSKEPFVERKPGDTRLW